MLDQLQSPGKGDDVDDRGRASLEFVRCFGPDDPARGDQPGRPSTGLEGYALGQRLAFNYQCPYTQRQTDVLAGHNLVTFWLEECFDQLRPSGCAKDDGVFVLVHPEVFQDDVP